MWGVCYLRIWRIHGTIYRTGATRAHRAYMAMLIELRNIRTGVFGGVLHVPQVSVPPKRETAPERPYNI